MLQPYEEPSNHLVVRNHDPIRVLIVERHAAVRNALYQRLGAAAHLEVVGSVNELAAAMSLLPNSDSQNATVAGIDVIVLGLENGSDEQLYATLRQLQQLADRDMAVIALAPYADEGVRTLLQQAGVSRYLLKHIDSCQLIREIESAAGHYPHRPAGN